MTERSRARVIYRQPDQRASRAAGPAAAPTRLSLLLLALVLFSGGLVIGRGTARPGTAAQPAAPPASSTAAQSPAAAADAPAAPVRTAAGPDHTVAGVGVGWAHTQEGAIAAATDYTRVLGSKLVLDQARRHQAIAVIAAPSARAAMQRAADEAAETVRKGLHLPAGAAGIDQAVVLTVPLGRKVEHYDQHSARVAIWTTGLAGSATFPVAQASEVTVVDLEWVGRDWKQVRVSAGAAPTPLTTGDDGGPSPVNAFLEQTRQFKEYDYAPRP